MSGYTQRVKCFFKGENALQKKSPRVWVTLGYIIYLPQLQHHSEVILQKQWWIELHWRGLLQTLPEQLQDPQRQLSCQRGGSPAAQSSVYLQNQSKQIISRITSVLSRVMTDWDITDNAKYQKIEMPSYQQESVLQWLLKRFFIESCCILQDFLDSALAFVDQSCFWELDQYWPVLVARQFQI